VVAIVRSAMRHGIDNAEIIEERLGKVVYAILMHSKEQEKAVTDLKDGKEKFALLSMSHPTDPAIEGLRGFSANLHFSLESAQKRAICISGVSPGAGKSFISTNLSIILAQSGMRTLLVDADIRKGHLHASFAVDQEPGLSSVLAGVHTMDEVLCQTPLDNLHLVPSGKYPPNPVELLMGDRFKKFVKDALAEYDYVVFDSAPILSVVDPAIISREMGATFLVIKAGENTLNDASAALNRFKQSEVEIQGVLLNDLKPKALGQYGYGNYTYYGYGEYGKS
jgi:tyrosine-protein kinase Etk/Wzc